MERKTRSGKVTTPPPVPVPLPGKKRGRKKKSEIQETPPSEPVVVAPGTRRSRRGRNPDQSTSESSFLDADENNASAVTADISIEDDSQEPSTSFVRMEADEEEVEPTIELKEEDVIVAALPEETIPDQTVCNLEQQFGDVVLYETQKEEDEEDAPATIEEKETPTTIEEEEIKTVEDVEMKSEPEVEMKAEPEIEIKTEPEVEMKTEPEEQIAEEAIALPDANLVTKEEPTETQVATQEDETLAEKVIDFMDFEDLETPLRRRSRRLQTTQVESFPVKTEEPVSTPTVVETKEEPSTQEAIVLQSPVKEEFKFESTSPQPVPEVVQESIGEPQPQLEIRIEYTDERLKRYETIRDNIYPKKSDKKVCKVNKTMKCDCTITEEEVKGGELGCQFNCINRLLYIECGSKCRCGEFCDNQQFQRYNYSDCSVFDTKIKGFGIRANQDIPAETFIIEYVGEVLDNKLFEKRAKKYSENKNIHYYFMALKSNAIIDATKKGNISRFINHSCDPNAETQKWTVNGELRVGFFSRKDIKQGDEITFDYQYQRYGKEAQKCYCGALNCRGWIGENPLDDEEEETNESPDIDDAKSKKTKARKGRKPKATQPEEELKDDSDSNGESAKMPVKKREPNKKLSIRLIRRQQIDDLEIEEEIKDLTESGLKNRAHTIRLSRLVVRAKNADARSRLLKILINGDMPCRRLFLDYNGLKLLHNWMCDVNVKSVIPDLNLCIDMMNALEVLPITNKTVLRTSKVLDRVDKWKNLDLEKKKLTKEEKKQAKAEKKKNKVIDKPPEVVSVEGDEEMKAADSNVGEVGAEPSNENIETSNIEAVDELTETKLRVKKVASELLEKWEDLKEDFKIPKKQKQEIMIEHEREADNDDWDSELQRGDALSQDRYKNRFGNEPNHVAGNRQFAPPYSKKQLDPVVSKQQHRQIFEMRVAQQDTEKKMIMHHENNCAIFGLNSNTTSPLDVPVRVNRVTGEYNTIDGRIIPPPPNHYQFKYEPLTLSTNPDDYILPPIDLPAHWRFALDEYGRIYYYHEKIRQSQWEAPVKFEPLKVHANSEIDSPDSDESTTETEDSEEEELRELLEMMKRKINLPPAQATSVNPLILQSGDADDDELEKKIMSNMMKNPLDQPVKLSQSPTKRLKKKKRQGLTSIQFIRPRTESDKLYGRTESKRYKEVKEKLRQKKRRILKGEVGPDDETSEDDDIALDDSIESRRFVDEIDILEQSEQENLRKAKKEVDKKAKKPKPVVVDQAEVKRQFRDEMLKEIAKVLQVYRDESCEKGQITSDADFTSLVSKLTYSVLTKESRHCQIANSMLKATESVKGKTREYIKKYMGKFEGPYQRRGDEQDYASILNKF